MRGDGVHLSQGGQEFHLLLFRENVAFGASEEMDSYGFGPDALGPLDQQGLLFEGLRIGGKERYGMILASAFAPLAGRKLRSEG